LELQNVKAILLDHDGTLVDSEMVHYHLWAEAIDVDTERFTPEMCSANLVGIPTLENARFLIRTFNLGWSEQGLADHKDAITEAFLKEQYFPLLPDIKENLRAFQEMQLRMAIVSGSERFAVDASVKGNNISEFIEHISTGDEVANNKPAPDVYLLAMEKMRLQPHECIAIEDTEHGLKAAIAAGIQCVAIPNEHTAKHDFSLATKQCASMTEFVNYLSENR